MLRLLPFCFLLLCFSAVGQHRFPADFIGHWEGDLLWYKTGNAEPQKVKMALIIQPTDSAGTYTWQMKYGDAGQDNRPYLLVPIDTAKGHWRVDERNGILLDQYWVGNRFTSAFTVGSTTIVDSYWRQADTLLAEFYSLSAKPVATTGNGTEDSPKVDSYATKSYQRAVLIRRR